jgi:hypothetical protein
MGEKGMETPAPTRSGVAGAAEAVGRMTGMTDMAAAAGGGSIAGGMAQGAAGMGEKLSTPVEETGPFGRPPKG